MNTTAFLKEEFKKLNEKIIQIKSIDNSMLGGIHEKYWLEAEGKKYLFKYNLGDNDFSDFGEVFTSYLAYLLNFKCVKSIFAKDLFGSDDDKNRGVLIESYLTKNIAESVSLESLFEKYKRHHFNGYTVKEVIKVLKEYCEDYNLILDNNLEQELKEMALIDYLLVQCDRHDKNIEFLIENKKGKKIVHLAPMFDNGFCMHLSDTKSQRRDSLRKLNKNEILKISLKIENPKPNFYIESTEEFLDEGECIVTDLATELLQNKKLKKLYNKFIKLNIKEEIEFISSIYKKELNTEVIELMVTSVKNRVDLLNEELKLKENKIEMSF